MLQKNAFDLKNFKFHAWIQKYHLGNFLIRENWKIIFVLGSYESLEHLEG